MNINKNLRNFSGIYKITCIVNNKFYIGSAVDFYRRLHTHSSHLKNNKHDNRYLQAAWNKYGKDSFIFETLKFCKKEDLIKTEQWFIDNLKPDYNLSPTAGSNIGYVQTEQEKVKRGLSIRRTYILKHNIPEERIISLINEGKSQLEVADILGYKNVNRICKFLKVRGIIYNNNLLIKRHKEKEKIRDIEIENSIKEGLSIKDLVIKLKSSKLTISKSIKRLGLWEERYKYKK